MDPIRPIKFDLRRRLASACPANSAPCSNRQDLLLLDCDQPASLSEDQRSALHIDSSAFCCSIQLVNDITSAHERCSQVANISVLEERQVRLPASRETPKASANKVARTFGGELMAFVQSRRIENNGGRLTKELTAQPNHAFHSKFRIHGRGGLPEGRHNFNGISACSVAPPRGLEPAMTPSLEPVSADDAMLRHGLLSSIHRVPETFFNSVGQFTTTVRGRTVSTGVRTRKRWPSGAAS